MIHLITIPSTQHNDFRLVPNKKCTRRQVAQCNKKEHTALFKYWQKIINLCFGNLNIPHFYKRVHHMKQHFLNFNLTQTNN